MSMEKRLLQAALAAAQEAASTERARILWIMQAGEEELVNGFNQKILIESERHAAETKLKLARVLYAQLRIRIASGVHPCNVCNGPTTPNRITCERCMLTQRKENGDHHND